MTSFFVFFFTFSSIIISVSIRYFGIGRRPHKDHLLKVFRNAGGNSSGGVNEAWRSVGEEMEAAAEAHRVWGIALSEQLAKPLRVSPTYGR